ncbi:hypothetical protein BN3590_01005 [Clostridium sp. C105KSO15]|nr:hypothetical protein BN3590_01005 [Clostridium sp. C105KSO15]
MRKKLILLLILVTVFSCGCTKEEQENLVLVKGVSLIHISEPTRLGMISYAVFCLKKKKAIIHIY